jgi:hypothetical protein
MLPAFIRRRDPRLSQLLGILGKASHDLGLYDAAFDYFNKSKAVTPNRYDAKAYDRYVAQIGANISRADYFGRGDVVDTPVFVVGMPRCGSTLLAQVLSGHPQIGSAGESRSLRRIMHEIGMKNHDGARMVKAIKEMPADAARRLAARYVSQTHQEGTQRTIDKSLHNFELLGFMGAMMPHARVIHVLRDPMDHCVSCYLQTLPAGHHYNRSLAAVAHAYRAHRRLMDHWKKTLPNPIMTVHYEDLVTDLEGTARGIIDFLGLDWDAACLDFQANENQVQTISVKQVRQPLYQSSIQRWRQYEAHLGPLKSGLAPFYPGGFDKPAV